MTYGFFVKTGSSVSPVDLISSDSVPGVFLDQFYLTFSAGTTTTKTYSSFYGSSLFVVIVPDASITAGGKGADTAIATSINNSTKTISLTCDSSALPAFETNAYVMVLGV